MVKHGNYWFNTHKTKVGLTAGLPKHIDIAIIGGGANGFSLLFDLITNTTLSVALLESAAPAFHASGRNIGHVSELDPISLKNVRDKNDDDIAAMYLSLIRLNNEWLRSVIRREKIDCEYRKSGGIYVSNTEDDGLLEAFAKFNSESCKLPLDKQGLRSIIPTERFESAVYVPGEAVINPFKYVNGIYELCEQVGKHVLFNSSVQRVVKVSDGFKIYVRDRGRFIADAVVHCTGSYVFNLIKSLKEQIAIWKTHVISVNKIADELLKQWPSQILSHLDKTVRLDDGRLLISGGIDPVKNPACDGLIEQPSFQRLDAWWRSVFPSIPKTISASSVWSYVSCIGKDGLPLIGPINNRPGEYINIGSDLNFSLIAAFILRNYLCKDGDIDSRWKVFSPNRIISEQE